MTKSEMIRRLANALPEALKVSGFEEQNTQNLEKLSVLVVSLVEELGMVPPERRDPVLLRKENKWE